MNERIFRDRYGGAAGGAVVSAALAVAALLANPVSASTGAPAGHAAPASAAGEPLKLGLPYVVPPHQPGAKVRTPEGLAPILAERLATHLPVAPVAVESPEKAVAAPAGQAAADALLLPVATGENAPAQAVVIPTGYRAGIMAIMRTDTDIKRWEDLKGRTVCIAEGGGLAGQLQARYGAIEQVYRAPADALLNLRIGTCDAAVHDSTMLQALLEFPEWKKFSAQLPVLQERDLAFIVSPGNEEVARVLQTQVAEWRQDDLLKKLTRQAARDIAFEVYLDQEVPDCH